jgi:hypothetical protein
MKLKNIRSIGAALLLVGLAPVVSAFPWPGISFYSQGRGCVFLLLEMTLPNGGSDGRVAFTHADVDDLAGTVYYIDVSSTDWGVYGFNGTGICWATAEAWGGWAPFWGPWGNPF